MTNKPTRLRRFKCSNCGKEDTPPLRGPCTKCGRMGSRYVKNRTATGGPRHVPDDYRPRQSTTTDKSCIGCGAINRNVPRGGKFGCWRCWKEQETTRADGVGVSG